MEVKQVRFSRRIKSYSFEKWFKALWQLDDYNDPYAPCFFGGIYNKADIRAVNRHKGFKIVWVMGVDVRNAGKIRNGIFWKNKPSEIERIRHYNPGADIRRMSIAIKDYSMFQPVPLGDKVYCYIGNGKRRNHYGYNISRELQKLIDFEIIYGIQGKSIKWVRDNWYSKSFINLRLNPFSGGTTANEQACMGRYTIGNNQPHEFYISYDDLGHAAETINRMSKYIGTIPRSLYKPQYDPAWKQVENWK